MGRKAAKKTSSGKTVRKSSKKIQAFTLTKEERLELENLQLKDGAIRERLNAVAGQQQVWAEAVKAKYKVDLNEFVINTDTGVCERRELKPVPDVKKEGNE